MSDYRFTVAGRTSGRETLPSGTTAGTLVASWDSVPLQILLNVETDSGEVLYASLDGDARDDGFDFSLSGETLGVSKLHWICNF